MPATLVPSRVTPVPLTELARALDRGFQLAMGGGSRFPSARSMAGAFGQLRLESGNGLKVRGFNFHNEKKSSTWEGEYQQYACTEIFDARMTALAHKLGPCADKQWRDGPLRLVLLPEQHPWSAFVAFESAEEGLKRYIDLLAANDRYAKAWTALYRGDWAAFAHELHAAGYYTADETQYTTGLVSIANQSLRICADTLAEGDSLFTHDEITNIEAQVALVASDTIWMHDRFHAELVT
jgi:hypothetical protein